ncbi:TIR domain-containing protein [Oleiharenicola sp. Vm1]|jgi:hypothetical protein|uniref:TIR domain-containing protein n=1 Tax=Oleiharenicola sp. Vm1 TaxID=3398393 RepID=UPI0039F585B8
MPKKVFFSFHYENDNWRAAQVRNMGLVDGSIPAKDNDWEAVKRGGDAAIQKWIDGQIAGRVCGIVLIGSATAGRKWIQYEIGKCWNDSKGLLGIYIHGLKDVNGFQGKMGNNPFADFTLKNGSVKLSDVVPTYLPPYSASTDVYAYIKDNLESWIDHAIRVRNTYS